MPWEPRQQFVIHDPDTGEPYWPIGCAECGEAQWWVCAASREPRAELRVALVCTNCTHATKGLLVADHPPLTYDQYAAAHHTPPGPPGQEKSAGGS